VNGAMMCMDNVHHVGRLDGQDSDLSDRGTAAWSRAAGSATGRRKSDLIREALDGYLADHQPKVWKDALEAVRGTWADRDDLDDFVRNLRAGWEKRLERLYGR
jgi:hypothetical protein